MLGASHVVICGKGGSRTNDAEYLRLWDRGTINPDVVERYCALFRRCCEFIELAIQKNSQAKVILCCSNGLSWSIMLAIAYVMYSQGVGTFEAYNFVRRKNLALRPNATMFSALFKWEMIKGARACV